MKQFLLFAAILLLTASGLSQESFTGPAIVSASRDFSALPNESGQFWVVYDIKPYTSLYPALQNPEQTLVNWILFDTGNDFWHRSPFVIFTADKERICVYHNEKVQQYISNVLDRFLNPNCKNELFSVQIVVVATPDWRTRCAEWLRPYPVKAKGISGWTIDRANLPTLLQTLAKRSDFVELNASRNVVPNAETFGWVLPAGTRSYVRDIQVSPTAAEGYVADSATIDEGYRIEVTPLLSTNGELIEFLFACRSTAVEKMLSVPLKVPTSASPRQQLPAEVPQVVSCDIQDKISFPKDQIFLVDMGMIPIVFASQPEGSGPLGGLSKIVGGKSVWRNVLIFVQSAGTSNSLPEPTPVTEPNDPTSALPSGN